MALTKDFCLKLFPSPFKLTQFHNKHCLKPLLVPGTMPSIANQGSTAPKGASSLMAKTISGTWRVRLMTSLEAEEWLPFPSVHQIPGEQNREGHLGQEGHMHKSGGGKEPSWWPVRVELRVQEQSKQAEARLHRGGPVGCDSVLPTMGPGPLVKTMIRKGAGISYVFPKTVWAICPSARHQGPGKVFSVWLSSKKHTHQRQLSLSSVSPVLEPHLNGIIQYGLSYLWLL